MYFLAGQIIYHLRHQQGLSQEELAEGILGEKELDRFESSVTDIPTKEKIDALFQRLGYFSVSLDSLPYKLSTEEHKVINMRDGLHTFLENFEIEKASEFIKTIEATPEFQDGVNRQYLLKSQAAICLEDDPERALSLLEEAINITLPGFDEEHMDTCLLTYADMEILTEMAAIYQRRGEADRAVDLLNKLIYNVTVRISDQHEKTRNLVFVQYALARLLNIQERYEESLAICDKAIAASQKNKLPGLLPQLMYTKASCLFYLNRQLDEVKTLVHTAIYGCIMMGMESMGEILERQAYSAFGISLEEQLKN